MNNATKTPKIGLLGGTFDPIHNGHIMPAKQASKRFSLNKVLVIPTHNPPHKNTTIVSTEHRVKMAELASNSEELFELDTREIQRSTLSYTIDTLKEIKTEHPNSELFFIMGMDSLLNFTCWHLWQDILLQCHLIVNTRPGYDLTTMNTETQRLLAQHQLSIADYQIKSRNNIANKSGYIFLHNTDAFNISSTKVRANLNKKIDCSKWLTNNVIQYITTHQLYTKT